MNTGTVIGLAYRPGYGQDALLSVWYKHEAARLIRQLEHLYAAMLQKPHRLRSTSNATSACKGQGTALHTDVPTLHLAPPPAKGVKRSACRNTNVSL